ncbi:hypothetical protein C2E23DRAFT_841654 [Lenzites betulinus]|nr:hypothetical protein C2E23DRAFT_841654 [Lenzites betulinus]
MCILRSVRQIFRPLAGFLFHLEVCESCSIVIQERVTRMLEEHNRHRYVVGHASHTKAIVALSGIVKHAAQSRGRRRCQWDVVRGVKQPSPSISKARSSSLCAPHMVGQAGHCLALAF